MNLNSTVSNIRRQSGIELLRIVAMLLVLVIHANYWRVGRPSISDAVTGPVSAFMRIFIQMLASPCVDVFIIISGYFSIKPKFKSFANLYFLLFFWAIITEAYDFYTVDSYSPVTVVRHVVFPFMGWFISAYLGLYLIAPILNAYVDNSPKRALSYFLVTAFSLQTFFDIVYPCWGIMGRTIFNSGYSILSFAFLYLLGRYIKVHEPRWAKGSAIRWGCLYFLLFLAWAIMQFIMLYVRPSGSLRVMADYVVSRGAAYTNPIVIIGSLALFLMFREFRFTNTIINRVAGSALAVFCFHSMSFYEVVVKRIYANYNGIYVLLIDGVFILGVFMAGVLIDQVRILIWNIVVCRLFPRSGDEL